MLNKKKAKNICLKMLMLKIVAEGDVVIGTEPHSESPFRFSEVFDLKKIKRQRDIF